MRVHLHRNEIHCRENSSDDSMSTFHAEITDLTRVTSNFLPVCFKRGIENNGWIWSKGGLVHKGVIAFKGVFFHEGEFAYISGFTN